MATTVQHILTDAQLSYLLSLPDVIAARERMDSGCKTIYFSIELTDDIKSSIRSALGIDLTGVSKIPMRWMKGDTAPHVDRGAGQFEHTYLIYLNDVTGEFVLDGQSYPIQKNTGFVFHEGLSHETVNTGLEPRLLLGPMSESGIPVGGANITYYPTEADALAYSNALGFNTSTFVVGDVTSGTNGGFTSWRIASTSSGPADQLLIYANGTTLSGTQFVDYYYLYPAVPCFLEGSKILCIEDNKEVWKPIEEMRKGTLVKTSRDGYKKVELIAKGPFSNPDTEERIENRLYKCPKGVYKELTDDLILTGCHSILVDTITEEERQKTIKSLGRIFITDRKYRLMACIDKRAQPYGKKGTFTIWHFALENADEKMNYGVYANGGLLVETCSINFLKKKGNLVAV